MRSPSAERERSRRARPFGARDLTRGIAMLTALLVVLAAVDLALRWNEDVLVGRPRVIDGDSLDLAGENVRLAGLDAPERAQQCTDARGDPYGCGAAATDYLTFLIDGGEVTCRGRGRDRYRRLIGTCRANGVDLSVEMIRRGWAVAYLGDLDAVESEARERGVGLWAGTFDRPADWRRARRTALLSPVVSPVALAREAIAGLAARLRGEPMRRAPADE